MGYQSGGGQYGAPQATEMMTAYMSMLRNSQPDRYIGNWSPKDTFSYATNAGLRYPTATPSDLRYHGTMSELMAMPATYQRSSRLSMRDIEAMPVLWQRPDSRLAVPKPLEAVVDSILAIKK